MAFQNTQNDDEEQPVEEELQPPQQRLDARAKNNKYARGTGPNTGLAASRTGTINRDGTTSPVSTTFGTATGSLTQPIRQYSPEQLEGMKDANSEGFGKRAGRLDARPRNNIYMPGTGPGTGRTAIRVGTINRDGSASPVSSSFGTATGSLSQRSQSKLMTPRPTPPDAYAQRQSNVANAKANGTFDAARAKFNGANSGQIMDEQGNISKNPNATKFDQAPDGQGGDKFVPVPPKNTPPKPGMNEPGATSNAPNAGPTKFDQVPDGQGGYKMVPVPPKKTLPTPPTLPVQPQPVAATPGLADTIKTGTQPLGGNPLKGMEMPKPPMPAVIGSPAPAASPAMTPSPLGVKPAAAPKPSVLGMPSTGTLGGNTQPFGSGSSALGGPLKLPGRAKGGPVQAGKPYLVGEEGPEIIVPGHSGTVVPNHAIQFDPMGEGAAKSISSNVRSEAEPMFNESKTSEANDTAAPRPGRQISGLFMKLRAMPAEFAQQQSGGRGSFSGSARSDAPGNSGADTAPETSARDEADDERGYSWGNRPPQARSDSSAKTAGRWFENRDAPEAFLMQQRGMRASGSSSQQHFRDHNESLQRRVRLQRSRRD